MTKELDPTASLLACFGYELRRYRNEAGLSQEALGRKCIVSGSQVRMIEHAERKPDLAFAQYADQALGTGGALERLWWHVNRETHPHPAWFGPFAALEREAATIREYAPMAIPGLLQTREYAWALFRAVRPADNGTIEKLVAARLDRQEILARDEPPTLWVIVDEGALRRPVGGTQVMRGQLDRLIEAAQHPKIVIQVVSLETWTHAGVPGGFTIAGFMSTPDVAYVDSGQRGTILDRADEVAEFTAIFGMLQVEALSQGQSFEVIKQARAELGDED